MNKKELKRDVANMVLRFRPGHSEWDNVAEAMHIIIDALPDELSRAPFETPWRQVRTSYMDAHAFSHQRMGPDGWDLFKCDRCGKEGTTKELHAASCSGGPEPVDAGTSSETATLHRLSELINKVASGETCATLSEFRAILGPQTEPPATSPAQPPEDRSWISDFCVCTPADGRKLRIMKAMEDVKTSDSTNPEFVYTGKNWYLKTHLGLRRMNDYYSPNENGVPEKVETPAEAERTYHAVYGKPPEPLWEGSLLVSKLANGVFYAVDNDYTSNHPDWRRIKVRELRP